MLEDLREWLNGSRNYAAGVQIYLKHGKDARLRNCFLEQIESDFKKTLLLKTITDLYRGNTKAIEQKENTTTIYLNGAKSWPADNQDEIVINLREQWRPLYGEMSSLQARIHDVALQGKTDINKKLEACQMAARIVLLDKKIRDIYSNKSFYEKNKRLPDQQLATIEVIGPIEKVFARAETLKRYLRDLKKKLTRAEISDIKKNKWVPKWDAYCNELRQLNNRLQKPENEGIPDR